MIDAILVLMSVLLVLVGRRQRRAHFPASAVIVSPRRSTVVAHDGAVHSVQSAELTTARADLDRLWNAANLENLGRTYWRFLSRVTLGLIRVIYGEHERRVVFLARPLTLLRFDAPEYEFGAEHGSIRWRIRDGLLVARAGRGSGFLAIEVQRQGPDDIDRAKLRIEVEVANFYPSIASGFSVPVYEATQSVVHVLVTHAFLRSLAKLDLAQSRVGALRPEPPASEAPPEAPVPANPAARR